MSWEAFEHQADIGLAVEAPDGESLFVEAGIALLSLVCDIERVVERASFELTGEAGGVEELLVDWLNDILYLFEGEQVVCRRIEFPAWTPTAYRALLHGEPADPRRHELRGIVKAATYHGLAVERGATRWSARIILDV